MSLFALVTIVKVLGTRNTKKTVRRDLIIEANEVTTCGRPGHPAGYMKLQTSSNSIGKGIWLGNMIPFTIPTVMNNILTAPLCLYVSYDSPYFVVVSYICSTTNCAGSEQHTQILVVELLYQPAPYMQMVCTTHEQWLYGRR